MKTTDPNTLSRDPRVVLTLDAGGTKLRFSAYRSMEECIEPFFYPSSPTNVAQLLESMQCGFARALELSGGSAAAISFGFPGPADYEAGIIGALPNLKGFTGGLPLKAFLESRFGLPVFINNDGNLFALGESAGGFLPWVNDRLARAGSAKHFSSLVGFTLGTGFGCGIVCNGRMLAGDNGAAGEVWLLRNKLHPERSVESTCGRYGIKKTYAALCGIRFEDAPEAHEIEGIALGKRKGNRDAAVMTYEMFGEVAGDAAASVLTLIDGLLVIGGGIANARGLFVSAMLRELNGTLGHVFDERVPRMEIGAYDLDEPESLARFLAGDPRTCEIPGEGSTVSYDALKRTGIGMSRLGTGRAMALGAYLFAIQKLVE